jgi:hypothetical protein
MCRQVPQVACRLGLGGYCESHHDLPLWTVSASTGGFSISPALLLPSTINS